MKSCYGEERPQKVNDFLKEVIELCDKYDLSISHEDGHGAFIIRQYDEFHSDWLFGAAYDSKDYREIERQKVLKNMFGY